MGLQLSPRTVWEKAYSFPWVWFSGRRGCCCLETWWRENLKILATYSGFTEAGSSAELHEFWLNGSCWCRDQLWSARKVHNSLRCFKFVWHSSDMFRPCTGAQKIWSISFLRFVVQSTFLCGIHRNRESMAILADKLVSIKIWLMGIALHWKQSQHHCDKNY